MKYVKNQCRSIFVWASSQSSFCTIRSLFFQILRDNIYLFNRRCCALVLSLSRHISFIRSFVIKEISLHLYINGLGLGSTPTISVFGPVVTNSIKKVGKWSARGSEYPIISPTLNRDGARFVLILWKGADKKILGGPRNLLPRKISEL